MEKLTMNEILLKKGRKKVEVEESVTSSQIGYDIIRKFYSDDVDLYESFFILLLNNKNTPIGFAKISQGGVSSVQVDVKLVSKFVVDTFATGVILAHNHPSGNLSPSPQDIALTNMIKEAMNIFEVRVMDHLILGNNSYYSMADECVL